MVFALFAIIPAGGCGPASPTKGTMCSVIVPDLITAKGGQYQGQLTTLGGPVTVYNPWPGSFAAGEMVAVVDDGDQGYTIMSRPNLGVQIPIP